MQMIMWVVLGASVALAALLDYHLRHGQVVNLSETITEDILSFRFPANWKTWTREAEGDSTAHVASDTVAGITRTLIIARQHLPHSMAPAEYILRAMPLSGSLNKGDFKAVEIDGWPGESITWAAHHASIGAQEEYEFTNCSAIVLPGDEGILIRMDKSAPFDAADLRLYRQVLESISVAAPGPTDGGMIQLTGGTTVSVPSDLRLYPQPDALRQERMVAQITDEGGWISAEFVPVAVPDNQPSPALLGGLAAREQFDPAHPALANAWLTASILPQSPNHWTIAPQDRADDAIAPRRVAHLITNDAGSGVVVVLSAEPPASMSDLNHLWEELSANIHLGKSAPLTSALDAGAALARSAAPPPPADTWWVWSRGTIPIGFTHGFADRDGKYNFRYTVRRNWNGTATAVIQQWGMSDASSPWARMTRSDAEANPNNPLIPIFDQTTMLADGITTMVNDRSGHETPTDTPFNPAFLLSRYLPGALFRLTASPTALWTDCFPGVEAELFPSPLLLLASRGGDQDGLRCVVAQVNGTGRQSRWYFKASGAVDHADFAGDLHLRVSSEGEVESAFAGDRRLTIQPH